MTKDVFASLSSAFSKLFTGKRGRSTSPTTRNTPPPLPASSPPSTASPLRLISTGHPKVTPRKVGICLDDGDTAAEADGGGSSCSGGSNRQHQEDLFFATATSSADTTAHHSKNNASSFELTSSDNPHPDHRHHNASSPSSGEATVNTMSAPSASPLLRFRTEKRAMGTDPINITTGGLRRTMSISISSSTSSPINKSPLRFRQHARRGRRSSPRSSIAPPASTCAFENIFEPSSPVRGGAGSSGGVTPSIHGTDEPILLSSSSPPPSSFLPKALLFSRHAPNPSGSSAVQETRTTYTESHAYSTSAPENTQIVQSED